jgi:hypothetical protein
MVATSISRTPLRPDVPQRQPAAAPRLAPMPAAQAAANEADTVGPADAATATRRAGRAPSLGSPAHNLATVAGEALGRLASPVAAVLFGASTVLPGVALARGMPQPPAAGAEHAGAALRAQLSAPGSKRPVFVNADGFATPLATVAGRPPLPQAQEGLYRLALLISESMQSRQRVATLDALPLATRTKLADSAVALAKQSLAAPGGALAGLTAAQTKQLRSSAFSTLWYLATQAPTSAALQDRLHVELLELAHAEPHKRLAKHMSRMLDRGEYTKHLPADEKADVKRLFEARHPQKFDVGNLLDAQGYIGWEHIAGEGENFYQSDVVKFDKRAFAGGRFEKTASGPGYTDFKVTFNPPRGENGRVKGVKLRVRGFSNDMFDQVGQKKGISYGGHSGFGEYQEQSMVSALAKGLKASQPQLLLLDLCAGLDNLDDDLENLGEVEVLTTFGSSYFHRGELVDEFGQPFLGVVDSEGLRSLLATFESLSREEDYGQMRRRVADVLFANIHMRDPNVVFPTIGDYREVRWMHLDGDDDGRMDAGDLLFNFGLSKVAGDPSREFILRDNGAVDTLDGDKVKNAALDLNVASHYNATTAGSVIEHKFQGAGWFESSNPADLVRFKPGANHDGKPVFELQVNAGLAHASREAIAALVQYASIVQLADQGKLTGLDETQRKLMGLTFAVARLNRDGGSFEDDERIWSQLLRVLRLPADMPHLWLRYRVLHEPHDYTGNLGIVEAYREQLSAATTQKLKERAVGRPGSGATRGPHF